MEGMWRYRAVNRHVGEICGQYIFLDSRLHRVQNYLDTHYSSVRVVACLRSGVGVLLWKNWLVKKRESRLNRVRFGKR
ncbi:hypothetical protein L915_17554 [Phytophthora nicotianae]|uniref:Uncharacterized protein n=1 Tax=Phytophthora nicotianae TaxID=4792 RepID=W2FYW9_PHYNI|nr:hypothetical protein L915_17554 [Phytophthora nicotianae]